MKSAFVRTFFCACLPFATKAQITVKKLDKIVEQSAIKPEPYDSLQAIALQENFNDNLRFVGQKIYLHSSQKYKARMLCMKASKIPAAIDKTVSFNNYNSFLKDIESITTCVYKPINTSVTSYNAGTQAELVSDSSQTLGKYYTITNIYNRAQSDSISAKMSENLHRISGERTTDFGNKTTVFADNVRPDNYFGGVGFFLLKNEQNDSIFTHSIDEPFVSVAYFTKQQKLYDKKKFLIITPSYRDTAVTKDYRTSKDIVVRKMSEFICEVTLLEDAPGVSYVLTDSKGTTLVASELDPVYNDAGFYLKSGGYSNEEFKVVLKDEYLKRIAEAKLARAQYLAVKQQAVANATLASQLQAKKYRQDCIDKFGPVQGEYIAKGIVRIGMNQEMCLSSWGKPFDRTKTTVPNTIYEVFYYSWRRTLHFENGILVRIEQ